MIDRDNWDKSSIIHISLLKTPFSLFMDIWFKVKNFLGGEIFCHSWIRKPRQKRLDCQLEKLTTTVKELHARLRILLYRLNLEKREIFLKNVSSWLRAIGNQWPHPFSPILRVPFLEVRSIGRGGKFVSSSEEIFKFKFCIKCWARLQKNWTLTLIKWMHTEKNY